MGHISGLFAGLLLTQSVLCNQSPQPRLLFARHFFNSSLPGITQTFAGTEPIPLTTTTTTPSFESNATESQTPFTNPPETTTTTLPTASSTTLVLETTVFSTTWVTITEAHTFTQGRGTSASVRTIYVTKTVTEVIPCPTTTTITTAATLQLPASDTSTTSVTSSTTSDDTSSTSESTTSTSLLSSSSTTTSSSSSSSSLSAKSSSSVLRSTERSTTCSTITPPGPTAGGTTVGCTQWHVAQSGEYCNAVAQDFGIAVDDFMSWNPSVIAPTCPNMLAGYAYCVATCDQPVSAVSISKTTSSSSMTTSSSSFVRLTSSSSSTLTSSTLTTSTTTSTPAVPVQTGAASQEYQVYSGDGTVAQGWPSEDQWVDFEYMFEINAPDMRESCAAWGVPNNSDEETATIKDAIQSLSAQSGVDARLILAVIMQESTGCVRVITTAYSVLNPGLMQSHAGAGTCNTNNAPFGIPGVSNTGTVQDPCPASEIYQMVRDGTAGTDSGDGLQQLLVDDDRTDVSRFYRAARMYNGGRLSIGTDGNLETGCCTTCYVSDIANRLTGWTNAPRVCDL